MVLVNPADAMGQTDRDVHVRRALQRALDADTALRTPDRLRLARRGFGDPIPID